ncbi:hypothetical protein, partial [Okeania sp. SIO3I5]|uniref:hypothetical protein n=1 Tax=Okeania sp. SIO3I5 TaxID=2607805 RepID=UPI0025F3CE32
MAEKVSRNLTRLLLVDFWNRKKQRMRKSEKIGRKSKSKLDETPPGRFLGKKNQEHEKFRKDWQNKVSRNLTRLLLVDFWN